jgi:hypothetical protein
MLRGTEPLADEDVAQFALSNGTLHSWPFVRELLYALTSRIGYPPYTLGVVHFRPKTSTAGDTCADRSWGSANTQNVNRFPVRVINRDTIPPEYFQDSGLWRRLGRTMDEYVGLSMGHAGAQALSALVQTWNMFCP